MLTLSAEARKLLLPRRSVPGSATALDAKAAARLAAKLPKAYLGASYGGDRQAAIFERGIAANDGPLRPVRAEAHALLGRTPDRAEPLAHVRSASIDVLAAAECMLERRVRDASVLPLVAFARSPEDAIMVAVRADRLDLFAKGSWVEAVYVDEAPKDRSHHAQPRLPLREVICALDDDAYARVRAFAAKQRGALDLAERARLDWCFPDEPWGAEDLAAWPAATSNRRSPGGTFLFATTPTVALVRACAAPHAIAKHAIDLLCALPEDDAIALFAETIPPLLKKPSYGPLLKTPPREIATALACLRTPAAAEELAKWADNAILAPIVLAYFADAPELGAALHAVAMGKTKLAKTAARALGQGTKAAAKAPRAARDEDVPAVLRERPWRAKLARPASVLEGLAIAAPSVVGEPAPTLLDPPRPSPPANVRAMTKDEHAAWRSAVEKGEFAYVDYMHHREPNGGWSYLEVPEKDVLWAWNEHTAHPADVGGLIGRFGVAALPGFLRRDWLRWLAYEEGPKYLALATRFVDPRIAPTLARATQRAKAQRAARAWFRAHPLVGALGLVPDAVGPAGDARSAAEEVLGYLAVHGERAAVETAARAYGEPAAKAIAALLARDPLASGAGSPKPPSFLRRDRLPTVELAGGGALPADGVAALVEMLQVSPVDPPYAGVALVREACTAASLGELALELLEQWVMADAPGRHDWMLDALVHFPSEAGERRLAALAREWARKNQAKAIRACHALGALATDFTLLHLAHIAETTRFDALRAEATGALETAAAARGLSPDELGDRTVGEWTELDANGTLRLDYGPRSFVVTLDEQLAPVVRDEAGAVQKTLPRPVKTDDAKKAAHARDAWETLRADLEQLAQRQVKRLERAMVTGRRWTEEDFRVRIAEHRLLRHLARRLVWIAEPTKGAAVGFRVAEDGTFADLGDRAWALPKGARVRLAHPALDALEPWTKTFADYELLQPFPQLGRELAKLDAKELAGTSLARTAGVKVKATKVMGVLEARGWRRSSPGHVTGYTWALRGDVTLELALDPGFDIAELKYAGEQTTGALRASASFGQLDPVAVSEAVRDVDALRA
jgi:hypothetical protein